MKGSELVLALTALTPATWGFIVAVLSLLEKQPINQVNNDLPLQTWESIYALGEHFHINRSLVDIIRVRYGDQPIQAYASEAA